MMKNLFLDSQIWLDLYYFSNDDLTQFKKLKDMLGTDIRLFVTEQVKNEVKRNRENKIKAALSQFQELKIQFPNLCKGYDTFNTLKTTFETFKKIHKEFISNLNSDIEKEKLYADEIINDCFNQVEVIPYSEEIINKSVLRYKLGNPPGKENSYGDAINWELLLENVPENEDLFFVSSDKDFRSPINDKVLCNFLIHEWKEKKSSEIYFYTSLTMFFNENVKDIELKSENKKAEIIESLRKSPHFETTHRIIAQLNEYSTWNEDQVIELFKAADANNQIYSIINDDDIERFYRKIYKLYPEAINNINDLDWLLKKIGIKLSQTNLPNIPF